MTSILDRLKLGKSRPRRLIDDRRWCADRRIADLLVPKDRRGGQDRRSGTDRREVE